MSTSTLTAGPVRPGDAARPTPRIELDLPVALNAIHTAGLQVVPDPRGGTLVDIGHPALVALRPYLPGSGTWAWLTDLAAARSVGRAMRPAGTVVADGRARARTPGPTAQADLVVLTVEQLGAVGDERLPQAVLLDLSTGSADEPLPPWALSRPIPVEGFHLDLTGLPPDRLPERVDAVGEALRAWHRAGRTDRAVLVLRGVRTVVARHVVAGLLRMCRIGGLAQPVVRVDVTLPVLDVATGTVVRVVGLQAGRAGTVLEVDAVPRSLGTPLVVHGSRAAAAPPVDVMLSHRGRLVGARVAGGPLRAGVELAARGWTPGGRPVFVRGYPPARSA